MATTMVADVDYNDVDGDSATGNKAQRDTTTTTMATGDDNDDDDDDDDGGEDHDNGGDDHDDGDSNCTMGCGIKR
jgi:hypothetical protein